MLLGVFPQAQDIGRETKGYLGGVRGWQSPLVPFTPTPRSGSLLATSPGMLRSCSPIVHLDGLDDCSELEAERAERQAKDRAPLYACRFAVVCGIVQV